jgi:hypothetical protein
MAYYQRLPKELLMKILQFYTSPSSISALSKDQALHQPVRPIQNVQLLSDDNLNLALTLTWLMDTFITFFAVQQRLENAAIKARNPRRSEMMILESSFHADAPSSNRLQKPQAAEAALKLLEHAIRGSLNQSLKLQSLSPPDPRHSSQQRGQTSVLKGWLPIFSATLSRHQACLKSILDFFSDLVHLTSHADFEAGLFQAYLQIGPHVAELETHYGL